MRMTTVISLTEQMIFFQKIINEISYYEVYSIATSSLTPPYTLKTPQLHATSTKTCETPQPTRTEHLPETTIDTNSYYTPNSTATSSFTPRYALVIPYPHFISITNFETQ